MFDQRLKTFNKCLSQVIWVDRSAGPVGRPQRIAMLKRLLMDRPRELFFRLPSSSWLSTMVTASVQKGVPFKQAVLAGIDAGKDGIVAVDFTFGTTKGTMSDGDRAFIGVFTGINGDGEVCFGIWVQSDSIEQVIPFLQDWSKMLEKTGGNAPKIFYVDYVEGMEHALLSVFPQATVRQDLWHILHRYAKLIPDDHSLKSTFIHALRGCLFLPYDTAYVDTYYKERGQDVPGPGSAEFYHYYNRQKHARWATPSTPQEIVANLESFAEKWIKPGLVCKLTEKELPHQELRELHCRTIKLAQTGAMNDHLEPEDMYAHDAQGKLRCKRSTSQLEGRHRHMAKEQTGTRRSVETAHWRFVNGQFNHTITVRPKTLPFEYKEIPTDNHELAQATNHLVKEYGTNLDIRELPFSGLSVPLRNVTANDYQGGLRAEMRNVVPVVDDRNRVEGPANVPTRSYSKVEIEQNHRGALLKRLTAERKAGNMEKVAELEASISKVDATIAELLFSDGAGPSQVASTEIVTAGPTPEAGHGEGRPKRAAAAGAAAAVAAASPRKRHRAAGTVSPPASLQAPSTSTAPSVLTASALAPTVASPVKKAAHKFPIQQYHALDARNKEHLGRFFQLVEECKGKRLDYEEMASRWNTLEMELVQKHKGGSVPLTHGRYLREFHTCVARIKGTEGSLHAVQLQTQSGKPVALSSVAGTSQASSLKPTGPITDFIQRGSQVVASFASGVARVASGIAAGSMGSGTDAVGPRGYTCPACWEFGKDDYGKRLRVKGGRSHFCPPGIKKEWDKLSEAGRRAVHKRKNKAREKEKERRKK